MSTSKLPQDRLKIKPSKVRHDIQRYFLFISFIFSSNINAFVMLLAHVISLLFDHHCIPVSLPLHLKVLKINVMWPPTGAICIPSMKLAEHNMQLSIVLFTLTCPCILRHLFRCILDCLIFSLSQGVCLWTSMSLKYHISHIFALFVWLVSQPTSSTVLLYKINTGHQLPASQQYCSLITNQHQPPATAKQI